MSDDHPKSDSAQTKKANEERSKAEIKEKRSKQLDEWHDVESTLQEQLKEIRANVRLSSDLSDHSSGFYEEVNKLAKNKITLQASPLVRQNANDIIADAKKLVVAKEDVHLDRIHEFVPAGDEPLYTDILVVMRSIRNCLKRHQERQTARIESLQGKLKVAATVIGALEYFLNDEDADDETREYPSQEALQGYTTGEVSKACLTRYADTYEYYFDFDKLDSMSPQEYVSALNGDDDDDGNEENELLGNDDEEEDEEEGHET